MNKDLEEQFLESNQVFDGKLLKVYSDTVLLPNGDKSTREWIKHPGAVAVVPILDDGKIAMVKQYRYPMGKITLEIPAGKLDADESPEHCVMRELKEETGYTTCDIKKLTAIATTVGFSNELIHLYMAKNLVEGEQCPDEDEFINVEKYTYKELEQMIQSGEIIDAKTIVALLMIKNLK